MFAEFRKFVRSKQGSVEIERKTGIRVMVKELGNYLLFDLLSVFSWGILIVIAITLSDSFREVFNTRERLVDSPPLKLFYVVILAPVVEEIAFRLPLRPSKTNLALGLSFQFVIALSVFRLIGIPLIGKLSAMVLLAIALRIAINERFVNWFTRNSRAFLYYNVLAFGLIHIPNYEYATFSQVFYFPLLILIQIVLGLYLSYVRVRFSFGLCLGFHILHNSLVLLIGTAL